ncbi:STAS domain-containing protein [Bacillus sp. USDA818B3_A]|uniref:STAS domain-containing protein n=1 Tax=Bacillus sp. USDA818B3_A TaxID=2698834 RepID=UPI00136FA209|nr:STAS domain-containing protein [Bacillus sp. USDA818B3_A]
MNEQLRFLGDSIINNRLEIAKEIHETRLSGIPITEEQKKEFQKIEQQILSIRAEFIRIFGQALINYNEQTTTARVKEWAEESGAFIFKLGVPLDEALKDTSFYRKFIWNYVEKFGAEINLTTGSIFKIISIVDPLLDDAVYYFSLTFVRYYEKTLQTAKNALLELTVPVIPLTSGVGVLPLIGSIDTERAAMLMDKTLEQANKLRLNHLILDVSGVLIIDTMVAHQLFKVTNALALIGVKTTITGIRPEVAQTVVKLGIDLDKITIKSNLHQAFEEIQLVK